MSLPPTFLDELRARLSLAQVVGRKVSWDQRKSNLGKGDLWAPCPFHQEKTASFHVDDRKGYYYCFGCHAKGDAISFVRETENVSFMEAVEILAREAGMPLPQRDPKAQEASDRRTRLSEVVEAAVRHYRLQLKTGAAAAARDYLARRGLDEAAIERFEIGYAPRSGLMQALTGRGFTLDEAVESGLCARPEDGSAPYDRFRDRIVFPIRDGRGRAVSLGGRALDPRAPAKYLNGPETPLFDKGRSLYNHAPAREAAGKGAPVIVAEGYMDVVALVMAGFAGAVAPLGTAITEDQLRLLWRLHPEPIVALDGDRAGLAAAMRLVGLALPLVEAGQSLRFALLPPGKDPDDLIREGGAAAMQTVLERAEPMVRTLWRRETEGQEFDSPERRAGLEVRLRSAITAIRDKDVRKYYAETLRHFQWERFRPPNWAPPFKGRTTKQNLPTASARRSALAQETSVRFGEKLREMVVLAACLKAPEIAGVFEGGLESFEFLEEGHQAMMLAILENFRSHNSDTLIAMVASVVGMESVARVLEEPHVRIQPVVLRPDETAKSIAIVEEQLARLAAERGHREEMEDAEYEMGGLASEGITWRLSRSSDALARAAHPGLDTYSADTEDREKLSNDLQKLIEAQIWVKKR